MMKILANMMTRLMKVSSEGMAMLEIVKDTDAIIRGYINWLIVLT
jgi:hypothetical protein